MWLWIGGVALAGVWVREPGTAWVQVGASTAFANSAFLPDGSRAEFASPKIGGVSSTVFSRGQGSQVAATAYTELGVLDGLEIFGSIPWLVVSNRWSYGQGGAPDLVQRQDGFGDGSAGLRVGGSLTGPVVGSLSAAVRGPLYNNQPEALNREAGNSDPFDDLPPLGAGTIEVDAGGALGVGFGSGWVQLESWLRLRNRGYAPALPGRVQVGFRPVRTASVFVESDWLATLPGGSQPRFYRDEYGKSPLVPDGGQRIGVGAGGLVEPLRGVAREGSAIESLGVLVRAGFVPWGQLTPAEVSLGASVTCQPTLWRP